MATLFLRTGIILAGEYSPARARRDTSLMVAPSDNFVKGALGVKKYQGIKYQTTALNLTGLLPPGSKGVNHGMSPLFYVTLLFIGLR